VRWTAFQRGSCQNWTTWAAGISLEPLRPKLRRGGDEYQELLASLYRALHDQTNCRVIVDSSKSPVYARLLGRVPELDVYVIHLVRDPRATAYSWSRVKPLPDFSDDRSMIRQTALVSARRWLRWQVGIELLWNRRQGRYLLLRYEDFVRNPQASLERILNLVEETPQTLPFVDENAVRLSQTHSVSGNPTRFKTGVVELRHDQEWLDRIRKVDRLSVTALTWPLLLRYRYKLR